MRLRIAEALKDGAWGVSAGLDYKPGYFARTDEVTEIVSVAKGWRTNFPNHERVAPETGFSGLAGARETVEIAVKAGMSPVFTHMKAQGAEQGRVGEIFALMDEVRAAGLYAAGDIYPYTFGFNNVRSLMIPAWALEGGEDALYARFAEASTRRRIATEIEQVIQARWNGPTGVYVSGLGRELTDIMAEWRVSAGEAIIRLNEQHRGRLPQTYLRFGRRSDMVAMLQHPDFAVSCDCGALLPVGGHPRAFGTFPRVLGHHVRDVGELSWEDAIRKMTALPASIIGMVDRGIIASGMSGDLVIFDPRTISDRGTDEAPQLAEGVRYVLVNGQLAVRNGELTGLQGGQVLRRAPNMPTRALRFVAAPIVGEAQLDGGARLSVDFKPRDRFGAAEGGVTVKDARGRVLFTSERLGVLQAKAGWAALTGQGRLPDGRQTAFTLVLDGEAQGPAEGRAVVLDVGPDLRWQGRALGSIALPDASQFAGASLH